MKSITKISFLAFIFCWLLNYNGIIACETNAYYNGNTFKGSVKEVPLRIIPPSRPLDLGSVEPGQTITPNKEAEFNITGALGYKFRMSVAMQLTDSYDGKLSFDGSYKLDGICNWTDIPNNGNIVFNGNNVRIPEDDGELAFRLFINELKAQPGAKVGDRMFNVTIQAVYTE